MQTTYRVEFLGCKVNQYEAEQIRRLLEMKGFAAADDGGQADIVVIHSCAVTAEAARKVRQLIRRSAAENPAAKIVVSGCAAKDGMVEESLPDPVYVRPGAGWLQRLDDALAEFAIESLSQSESLGRDILPLQSFSGRHRAFLKIQDGCDIGCSYCIVPLLRGASRDKPPDEIFEEARMLIAGGHREIVVTGVSAGLYGKQSGVPLADVIGKLADIEGVERLRLSSLHPAELTPKLLEVWSCKDNIMPHIHLPLQSGSDRILRRMRRGYTRSEFLAAAERAKSALDRPAFNTDVIVGFPGETEEDFARTMEVCRDVGFSRMHIFQYSARPGTQAARLDGRVPKDEVKQRGKELRVIAKDLQREYYERNIGRLTEVLVERFDRDNGVCRGYSDRYIPVALDGGESDVGRVVAVHLESILPDRREVAGVRC